MVEEGECCATNTGMRQSGGGDREGETFTMNSQEQHQEPVTALSLTYWADVCAAV
jgi:hypothetical protein